MRYNSASVLPDDRGAQTDTDVLLLQRLARRDASALGDLYDRHNRLLFGLIMRILGQRGEAEDVLQEVFMTAWTRAGIPQSHWSMSSWCRHWLSSTPPPSPFHVARHPPLA